MEALCKQIRNCKICAENLEHEPRPVFVANEKSKIIIIGQAPGFKVHTSGVAWDDKSGENLREWMGVTAKEFYNPLNFAIVPMGFCYPGKGKSGDLPPRKECAPQWHQPLLAQMNQHKLTLLIGSYAQKYYLGKDVKMTLTQTVKNYGNHLPEYIVLPHPSPRNNIWMAKNIWFKKEVVPTLKERVSTILKSR